MADVKISCLIVDDEPLARDGLRILLVCQNDIGSITEAENVSAALEIVNEQDPDVIFLDIKMPGQDGFALLNQLPHDANPLIVMVTAFPHFAVRGFDASAIDFLLKPVAPARLRRALKRVRRRMAEQQAVRAQQHAVDPGFSELGATGTGLARGQSTGKPVRLCLRDASRKVLVAASEIVSIEAAGDYMCVSTLYETTVIRKTLSSLLEGLNYNRLIRVHRSAVVNRDHVTSIRSHGNCTYEINLTNGIAIRSSKKYRAAVTSITDDHTAK